MTDRRLETLARELGRAWDDALAIPAPTTIEPGLSVADAYAIQDMVIAERLARGRSRAGWKLGLTSAPPPATPIVGTLLDDMVVPPGSVLDPATMVAPMVEAEVLVRIGETVDGAASAADLQAGPHEIGAGLEVIDYRTTDSDGVVDWIADNSTVAYAVLGTFAPISSLDPAAVTVELSTYEGHLASGRGDQVMGNPLAAVSWLSRHLAERGQVLERGEVILTGSLTGHHHVESPDRLDFTADFGGLGIVSVSFRA